MDVYLQCKLFCLFFLLGIIINFIFDLFRGVRKSFYFCNFAVVIQDIVFLIISGILFFKFIILFNNGEIRLYMLIALAFGMCIYALTISKYCVIIVNVILKTLKNIFNIIFRGNLKRISNILNRR